MRVLMCIATVLMSSALAWAQPLDPKKSADIVQHHLQILQICETQELTLSGQNAPANLRVTPVLRRGMGGVWRILQTQTATVV